MLNIFIEKYFPQAKLYTENETHNDHVFCRNTLISVLLVWNLFWFFIPLLVIPGVYFDVLENIEWGRYWQFGYDKHPFVSMWITRFFYELTGSTEVMYLLNQISISAAVICVWLLAKKFLQALPALAVALMPLTLQYYSSWAIEFNNDVIAISVWGAIALFFYNALTHQRIRDWLLTAFFCFLAVMTKYYAVVLMASMAIVVLGHPKGRKSFKHSGIYLAAILFVLLILPNVIWLFNHDFLPFKYAANSASSDEFSGFFMNRLMNGVKLFLVILERLVFFIIAYVLLFLCNKPAKKVHGTFERFYVFIIAFGPILLTMLFPLITGGKIKPTWLASCFSLWALGLFIFFNPKITRLTIYLLITWIGITGVILGAEYTFSKGIKMPYQSKNCSYEVFPGNNIADAVTTRWHSLYNTPLKYVLTARKTGCHIAYFSKDNPSAFYFADTTISPWIDVDSVKKYGGVLVWEISNSDQGKLPGWVENLGEAKTRIIIQKTLEFDRLAKTWTKYFTMKPVRKVKIAWAILPPMKE